MVPIVISTSALNQYMRKHLRKKYQAKEAEFLFDDYVYIDSLGNPSKINISVGGGSLFELPNRVLAACPGLNIQVLNNSIFLWMFVIRKYLQDVEKNVALNTPIVINLAEEGRSEMIEAVDQVQSIQQPMHMSDLTQFLNSDNDWLKKAMLSSLRLFGVTFSTDDIATPVLCFDVYTEDVIKVNSKTILAQYKEHPDLADALMTYVFAIASLTSSEIDAINLVCKENNILLTNSTLGKYVDTGDSEHRDDILNLGNAQSNHLLAQLGGIRSMDKKHSNFKDLIKLYSLLEECDCEVNINYNDFADSTYMDSDTAEIGMTEGNLRALALFHIQHPDNPIDFESMPLKQQYMYCNFVADLADRREGTLSDRLQALHSKYIGGLYTIDTPDYKRFFVRLDKIKLSSSNAINNDSIRFISLPITKLSSCLHFADNRPLISRSDTGTVYFEPLPYGEDPFDYRPDFVMDPLTDLPKQHTLQCIDANFFCDNDETTPISILPVLQTLMHTDILEPIMQSEILDYVDYGTFFDFKPSSDATPNQIDLTSCSKKQPNTLMEQRGIDIDEKTVGRSIKEKGFIVTSFIHRLLRYFESVMSSEHGDSHIPRRILSLADLLCYEYKGTVYIGIADVFDSKYEVTPLVPTITIGSNRRYAGTTDKSFSIDDCVMPLPRLTVSKITPSTIFNRKEELPTAVRAIVSWLNKQNNQDNEYEDYVSYGLQFDSWDAYLILQSCSAAGALSADIHSFFGNTDINYATINTGCREDIHAAHLEYKHGIISREEYISRTQKMCELYITSILTIPLYSLEYVRERSIICNSPEIVKLIDFRFFKNVRLQYSPLSIFGTWNDIGSTVTWHTSLLN